MRVNSRTFIKSGGDFRVTVNVCVERDSMR